MNYLRQFADAGVAVLVVAAVGRSKDKSGRSTYGGDSLSLASFRESSELEFGADDAFILAPDDDDNEETVRDVTLRHLKARHTEPRDLRLRFDRHHQSFTVADDQPTDSGKFKTALAELWGRRRLYRLRGGRRRRRGRRMSEPRKLQGVRGAAANECTTASETSGDEASEASGA